MVGRGDASALRVERRGSIEIIQLHRPERRNAMVPGLMDALAGRLRAVDPELTTALVITGTPPAFCAGADLRWLGAMRDPADGVASLVAAHHAAVDAMRTAPVPIVAGINGAAAGGGLSLALAADYRVAGAGASLTAAYARLGLPPDGGTSLFLLRAVGSARATELLLTNRRLSATDALAWGLVNEVAAPDELLERCCAAGATMAAVPAETLLVTRRLLDAAGALPLETMLQREALAMRAAARRPAFRQRLIALQRSRHE